MKEMSQLYFKKIISKHVFLKLIICTSIIAIALYIHHLTTPFAVSYVDDLYDKYEYYERKIDEGVLTDHWTEYRDKVAPVLESYKNRDWGKMNIAYLELLDFEYPDDYVDYDARLIMEEAEYFAQTGIQRELNDQYPVLGANFMISFSRMAFPYLFLLFSCYVLSVLFSDKDRGIFKFLTGIICLVLGGIIIHLIPYLIGTIYKGSSSFLYPYLCHDGYKAVYYPISSFILPGVCLLVVLSVFLYGLMYIINTIIKNKGISFTFSTVLLMGLFWIYQNVESIRTIAHFNPLVYLQFVDIISGNTAADSKNFSLVFPNGLLFIVIGILLETGIILFLQKHQNKSFTESNINHHLQEGI